MEEDFNYEFAPIAEWEKATRQIAINGQDYILLEPLRYDLVFTHNVKENDISILKLDHLIKKVRWMAVEEELEQEYDDYDEFGFVIRDEE